MSGREDDEGRFDGILEVLMSYARQDFRPRIAITERGDVIDAIATGINLLAEELDGEVASRKELEAAYARLQATQAQLLVAEKFAAVGQLASGVAHELNNPASWVLLGVESARRRLVHLRAQGGVEPKLVAELAAIEHVLDDVHAGMERMRTVIGDLRTLSRVDVDRPVEVDLDEVVRTSCQLARPAYLDVARIVLDLGGVPPIVGDRNRLGQVVTNLVVNAAYAVAEQGGEQEIVVSTRATPDHIVLAVEDTGPGIPGELSERVFEPYFTTKSVEVGSGLGLALVREIAERHGGTARAMRGSRGGARIEVALAYGHTNVPNRPTPPPLPPEYSGARARLLVIDDEPMLLRSLEQTLGDEHDVVTALGGRQALDILATDRAFDLIVCDLQMPGVDGVAVYESLAQNEAQLAERLVVMSGGAVTPRAAQFMERVRPRVIGKPIDLDDLLALAREAAGRGRARPHP